MKKSTSQGMSQQYRLAQWLRNLFLCGWACCGACSMGWAQPQVTQDYKSHTIMLDGAVPITAALGLPPGGRIYLNAVAISNPVTSNTSPIGWTRNGQLLSFTGLTPTRLEVTQAGVYTVSLNPSSHNLEMSFPVTVVDSPLGSGQLLSYVKETTVAVPGITTATEVLELSPGNYQQQTAYADGLGRPVESVQSHAAPNDQDLVSFQVYDGAGNVPQSYLPYARTTAPTATACLPLSTLRNEQTQFYQSTYRVASDDQPYGTTLTEASPLGRVTETRRAGDIDQFRQRRVAYQVNEAADQVRRWSVVRGAQSGVDGTYFYAVGDLSKMKATDEDGRVSYVFQDQLGRMVLRRQANQVGTTIQWLDTYTVYDEIGRACYLVPPGAVAKQATAGQWVITDAAFINRWLYVYTYDNRGRLVARQFPGAQPTCIVYDAYDRPVLTQDGNQRLTNRWSFTKFDAQNRPIVSGLYTESGTAATLQAQVDAGTSGAYEERNAAGYTLNNSFPVLSTTGATPNATLLTQTFYDDYDLDGDGTADYSYSSQGLGTDEPAAVAQPKGLATVQKTRIIRVGNDYGDWLVTALFYDQYDNLVQKRSNNHLNLDVTLADHTTLIYRDHGFVPQVLRSIKSQRITPTQPVEVRNRFAYDHAGRLLTTWQQNVRNGIVEPEVMVASHSYNALGQLVEKNLHSIDAGTSFLQSVDLAYDINGQLLSINNSALANQGNAYDDDTDVFGMELVRAQSVPGLNTNPRYDGKLSAVRWQVRNTRQQNQPQRERSYQFEYDGVGRLKDARYAAMVAPGQWTAEVGAYDERSITYDPNGNLKTLSRYTQDAATTSPLLLDRLQYSYGPEEGNQLQAVNDQADATRGFRDQGTFAVEYPVDANGNLTRDDNKKVNFLYNVLNKVQRQQAGAGRVMTYDYAADGTLLQRRVTGLPQNGATVNKIYQYVDGFAYEGLQGSALLTLTSVPTPEGRAVALQNPTPQPDNLVFEYHLRDHLGNLRVAFRAQAAPVQLHLTMEEDEDEEGAYPKFNEVAATRDNNEAQERSSSASVKQFQLGPHVRLPAANGDQIKIDLFYRTPSGEQYSFRPTPPKVTKPLPLIMALAPALLPAPGITSEARTGRPAAWWPGVQFSVSGLLAGRVTRQAKALAALQQAELTGTASLLPIGGLPPSPAYVSWNVLDEAGNILRSGQAVLPVTSSSSKAWDHATVNLPVDLSDTETRTGSVEVFLLNDGAEPVYFDSVTIRHPRPELVISQENHYYPFGMNLQGVAVNTLPAEQISKAQYNGGSELQDEVLDEGGVYSTPYRTYDPVIGRFQGVDPLADAFAPMTPYQFANNDPVNHNDPTGAYATDGLGHIQFKSGRGRDGLGRDSNGARDDGGNPFSTFTEINDRLIITVTNSFYSYTIGNDGVKNGETWWNETERYIMPMASPEWASKGGFEVHQIANRISIIRSGRFGRDGQLMLRALNAGTVYADGDKFQSGGWSYRHAMRNSNQTVFTAKRLANSFVRNQYALAQKFMAEGDTYQAYFQLAVGLHALQDATSPSHIGFQVWTGYESPPEKISHGSSELAYPGAFSNLQRVTDWFIDAFRSGKKLPDTNLFNQIISD